MTRSTSWTIPLLAAGFLASAVALNPSPLAAAEGAPAPSAAAAADGPDPGSALSEALERGAKPRFGTLGGRTGIDAEMEWDATGIEGEPGIDPEEEEEAHAVASCRKRANGTR